MTDNATTKASVWAFLVDDAYLAWLSAESECESALRACLQRTDTQRRGAYHAYRTALDREKAAARHLERVWRLAEPRDTRFVHGTRSLVE